MCVVNVGGLRAIQVAGVSRLYLATKRSGWHLVRVGMPVQIHVEGHWSSGFVDHCPLIGWYWQRGRTIVRLMPEDRARMIIQAR